MAVVHRPPVLLSLALIAILIGLGAGLFAYTAGWFSPARLTPDKVVAAFSPPNDAAVLGHRRNHAKGICFTGVFEANGAGSELSRARVFVRGQYPVLGRFNLATPNPNAPDATVRVRGLGMQISTPDGQEWRSAMIDPPVFTVSTPLAFYELLLASGSKDPNAMKSFTAAHPEFAKFADWTKDAPWTGSYAEERFNSLNSFVFVDGSGAEHAYAGRCCLRHNRSRSRPMNLRKVAPISSNRRSLSASPTSRSAGTWW
jgi:catalase